MSSIEEGISQYWTPELEEAFQKSLAGAKDFVSRYSVTSIRNALKYDHRSRASKKATADLQNTLAFATDDDLQQLAKLEAWVLHAEGVITLDEAREETIKILIRLNKSRDEVSKRLGKLCLVVEAGKIARERYHQ